MAEKNNKLIIGWNEWCQLPTLGIPAIRAKVDTGAQTSAIHAFNIQTESIKGQTQVVFEVHPIQANDNVIIQCQAPVVDKRYIMSSNGHKERRFVIAAQLNIADKSWEVELTLSNRDPLRYRMLLGREAMKGRVLINPSLSCHQGQVTKKQLQSIYHID